MAALLAPCDRGRGRLRIAAMNPIGISSLALLVAVTGYAAELKYTVVPNFFKLSSELETFGPCHGGAVIDKSGLIYVTTDTPRGMDVFAADGKYLRSLGPTKIHGLELREENGTEYFYAARPTEHEVVKLKLDGSQVWALHYPAEAG